MIRAVIDKKCVSGELAAFRKVKVLLESALDYSVLRTDIGLMLIET